MTTYSVRFRNNTAWACHDIKARTPEKALALARKLSTTTASTSGSSPTILRRTSTRSWSATTTATNWLWRDEELWLRLAAQDLLDALEELVARDRAEAAESGFTDDEMTWLEDARRAIAKAKGGAA